MKCAFCGEELKKATVTFSYEEDETYILVEHVPAEVCPNVAKSSIRLKSRTPCCSLPNSQRNLLRSFTCQAMILLKRLWVCKDGFLHRYWWGCRSATLLRLYGFPNRPALIMRIPVNYVCMLFLAFLTMSIISLDIF